MSDIEDLIAGLLQPSAYPHPVERVEQIETHISYVLLAGEYAYKVKKPLSLGFLDFSTLERRRFCCEEELRLNRRLAPLIYLEVVPITGPTHSPRVGGAGEALEYAVKMRRFDQDALLTVTPVTPELADRIAERVEAFHAEIPRAGEGSPYGTPDAVRRPMEENFRHIRARLGDGDLLARLQPLEDWTEGRLQVLRPVLERRRREGRIRECHGDMHRRNIALVDRKILIFDGIEFNPGLRWIDTMSELAFLVMDLEEADEGPSARRLLNRYLELSGDYGGLSVMDLYKVYRAMVRAKVTAIRLGQPEVDAVEAHRDRAEYDRYVALAEGYIRPHRARLFITKGVSGTGKSRLAAPLRERLPLIHIRSDLERKRLFGLPADTRTDSGKDAGIYTAEAGARTYDRLLALASTILGAGYSALVDATFLRAAQRRPFIALADEMGCPCTILELEAPETLLRERVRVRLAAGQDPSEADESILAAQLASQEPLSEAERGLAVTLHTGRDAPLDDLLRELGW